MAEPRFILGTGYPFASSPQASDVLDAHFDAGGRSIDTGRVYGSEQLIGEWIRSRGVSDEVLIGTKGGHPHMTDWKPRLSEKDVRADLETSLVELGVSRVDSFLLHRDDATTPVEEIASTLAGLIRDGMTRAIGVSNWSTDRVRELSVALHSSGGPALSSVSNYLGLAVAGGPIPTVEGIVAVDRGLVDLAEEWDFRVVAWSSRSSGYFEGATYASWFDTSESRRRRDLLETTALRYEVPASALLTRWLTTVHPRIVPVFGTRRPHRLEELFRTAGDHTLDAGVAALNAEIGDDRFEVGNFTKRPESEGGAIATGAEDISSLIDRMATAIASGAKTVSASLPELYAMQGQKIPQPGDVSEFSDSTGRVVCSIETVRVLRTSLGEVTLEDAIKDGSPDVGSFAAAHRSFWGSLADHIRNHTGDAAWAITDSTEVIIHEFRAVGER